ncbi:type 1 glutamine amidotransferase [Candidatus Micrarchaeota archaeon]|nr:type 1 glutamine amidotransferase [Candidatus Micrarchaeota archaeon]
MRKIRIAIIGCSPEDQKLSYLGIRWTIRGLISKKIAEFAQEKGYEIEPMLFWPAGKKTDYPKPGTYDAVIIPGSRLNIDAEGRKENPWMEGLLHFIRVVVADPNIPVLGICFGHQAIAVAHGSVIRKLPKQFFYEVGYQRVRMTSEAKNDELFRDFPMRFEGLFSHFCYVSTPPENSTVLAYGLIPDMIHAYRIGTSVWGVQFHPDFSDTTIAEMVDEKKLWLAKLMDLSKIVTVNPARQDHKILLNFLEHAVKIKQKYS